MPAKETPILESSGINLKKMNPIEMAFSGQERMDFTLDSRMNYIKAMYRKDVGWISFIYGHSGKAPGFENGTGIANIIAKQNWKNSHGQEGGKRGKDLVLDLVETIARGTVKRTYGPMGFKQYDVTYMGVVATLLWHRGRKTFYLSSWGNFGKGQEVLESAGIGWNLGTGINGC